MTSENPAPVPASNTGGEHEHLLTEDEHRAIELTGELWNLLNRVVGSGLSRGGDLAEICAHIHSIQHAVMSQAAARAYPDRYRLLGGIITTEKESA